MCLAAAAAAIPHPESFFTQHFKLKVFEKDENGVQTRFVLETRISETASRASEGRAEKHARQRGVSSTGSGGCTYRVLGNERRQICEVAS